MTEHIVCEHLGIYVLTGVFALISWADTWFSMMYLSLGYVSA